MAMIAAIDKDGDGFTIPREDVYLKQTSAIETTQVAENEPSKPIKVKRFWLILRGSTSGERTNEMWELTDDVYYFLEYELLHTIKDSDIIYENKEGE
jgi:hypothetical protein